MSDAPTQKATIEQEDGSPALSVIRSRKALLTIIAVTFTLMTGLALVQQPHPDPFHAQSFGEKLFFPQETNAFLRNQSTSADINDVTEINGVLWAVGDGGLILTSEDGGLCWEPRGPWVKSVSDGHCDRYRSSFKNLLSSIDLGNIVDVLIPIAHAAVEKQEAVVLPEKSNEQPDIRQQQIESKNPTPDDPKIGVTDKENVVPPVSPVATAPVVETVPNFESIIFVSAQIGIVVGDNGTILRSGNAGLTWTAVESSSSNSLRAITAIDAKQLVAVGLNGTILRSDNAGLTWAVVESNTANSLNAITAVDNQRLVAVGRNGTILRSNNAGGVWTAVESNTANSLNAITAVDNQRLVAVGDNGTILRFDNAGGAWTGVESSATNSLNAITTVDNQRLVAVGRNGTILHSDNAEGTWYVDDSLESSSFNSITTFGQGYNINIGVDDGTILRSDNAGGSWYAESEYRFDTSSLIDTATGDGDTILRSDNAGGSSAAVDPPEPLSITPLPKSQLFYSGSKILLSSDNPGGEWNPDGSLDSTSLYTITIIDDKQVIAVGKGGNILRSDNAGGEWNAVDSPTSYHLNAITNIDDRRIVAVGDGGTILRSENTGVSWKAVNSPTSYSLNGITAIDDRRIIAVGDHGTILRSDNAGVSWRAIDEYTIHIAYWWYLLALLSMAGAIVLLWPRIIPAEKDSISGLAVSDRPLKPGEPDALNLSKLAVDIFTFLSNPKTTAPFTLAITGPWGSGKSSLMNLVKDRLDKKGFSTVWFNAWHHQKGEQLLATLFAHIRQQAIPPVFSIDGFLFRLRLLGFRAYRHWFWFTLLFLLFAFTLAANGGDILTGIDKLMVILADPGHTAWSQIWQAVKELINSSGGQHDWFDTLAKVFGIGAPTLALLSTIRGFALNPKRLISGGQPNKGKTFDPGARALFTREFRDVTRALGNNKMVIFIDDLDRCSQVNLVDILENINFLSSSGDCFLILGMAPKYIEACVANAYQDLAKNIAEKESYELNGNLDLAKQREEGFKFDFAHNYLEKMINIPIAIPNITEEEQGLEKLLVPESGANASKTSNNDWFKSVISRYLAPAIPVVIMLLAIGVGLKYGYGVKSPGQPALPPEPIELTPQEQQQILSLLPQQTGFDIRDTSHQDSTTDEANNSRFSLVLQAKPEDLAKGIEIATLGKGEFKAKLLLQLKEKATPDTPVESTVKPEVSPETSSNTNSPATFRPMAIPDQPRLSLVQFFVNLSLFIALAFWLYGKRKDKFSKDSNDFKQALRDWSPWIKRKSSTPRMVKRFLNHLRFQAIRSKDKLNEQDLVAISTIHFVNSQWILDEALFKKLIASPAEILVDKSSQETSKEQLTPLTQFLDRIGGIDAALKIRSKTLSILPDSNNSNGSHSGN